jgi:hypothetical protein
LANPAKLTISEARHFKDVPASKIKGRAEEIIEFLKEPKFQCSAEILRAC